MWDEVYKGNNNEMKILKFPESFFLEISNTCACQKIDMLSLNNNIVSSEIQTINETGVY